jgi:hypothetical protein
MPNFCSSVPHVPRGRNKAKITATAPRPIKHQTPVLPKKYSLKKKDDRSEDRALERPEAATMPPTSVPDSEPMSP